MDKRLISSITKSIEKLDKKISANDAENFDLKNKREKFQEMLEMLSPASDPLPQESDIAPVTLPEPSNEAVPAFLKHKE
jgi:hypothetical protein